MGVFALGFCIMKTQPNIFGAKNSSVWTWFLFYCFILLLYNYDYCMHFLGIKCMTVGFLAACSSVWDTETYELCERYASGRLVNRHVVLRFSLRIFRWVCVCVCNFPSHDSGSFISPRMRGPGDCCYSHGVLSIGCTNRYISEESTSLQWSRCARLCLDTDRVCA